MVNKVLVPIVNIFEYLILQPCFNRAESKVLLLGGKAQYIISTTRACLSKKSSMLSVLRQFPLTEQLAEQIIPDTATVMTNDRLIAASLREASDDLLPSKSFFFPNLIKTMLLKKMRMMNNNDEHSLYFHNLLVN